MVSPEISLPDALDVPTLDHPRFDGEYAPFRALFNTVRSREAYLVHEPFLKTSADRYQDLTRTRLQNGADITDDEVAAAHRSINVVNERYMQEFDDHQILLTPTVPIDAPPRNQEPGAGSEVLVSQSVVWNMLGWPAVTIPHWIDGDPLPKSVQVIGKAGRDAEVLRAGQQLEQLLAGPTETLRPSQPQATKALE